MIARAVSLALLHFVWQGVVVAVVLSVVLAIARSPRVRYTVSCAALAVLAIAPAVTALVVYRPPVAISIPLGLLPPPISLVDALRAWTLPVWSLGVLLFSVRLVWGWGQVSVLRRAAKPAADGVVGMVARVAARMNVQRRIQVLISSLAESPSVVGWLKPVILLPAATVMGLTPEQLEAVIAHELAHIRRYDYLVNALQILVETALFYHPAVWWISSRIRHERELCCDDAAVAYCGDAVSYARALTILEKVRVAPSPAVASTGGSLRYRIERLLGEPEIKTAPSRWPAVLAIALAVVALVVNTNRVKAQAQLPPPASPAIPQKTPPAPSSTAAAGKSKSPTSEAIPKTEVDDHAAELRATAQFLETQLREAELKYEEGLLHFTPKYPDMVALRARIANLQTKASAAQLAAQSSKESDRLISQARLPDRVQAIPTPAPAPTLPAPDFSSLQQQLFEAVMTYQLKMEAYKAEVQKHDAGAASDEDLARHRSDLNEAEAQVSGLKAEREAAMYALRQTLDSQRLSVQARERDLIAVQDQLKQLHEQLASGEERLKNLQDQYDSLQRVAQDPAQQNQRFQDAERERQMLDRSMQLLKDQEKLILQYYQRNNQQK